MRKETKTLLKVLFGILVFLIVLYYLISIVYVPKPKPVDYPQGMLSDSLFTAQNNKYVKNDALPQQHVFETVPYSVDLPLSDPAHIGTGTVYKLSDTEFAYVSEYSDTDVSNTVEGIHEIIGTQFPAALLVDYIPESTQIVKQVDKAGYINGFSAQYVVDTVKVSNSKDTKEAVVMGYKLDMPSEFHEGIYAGKHIFIGIATTNVTSENLATCDQMLSVLVGTVHDDDMYINEEDKEKLDSIEKEKEEMETEPEASEEVTAEPTVAPNEELESDITTLYVDVSTEYSLLSIDVTWTNPAKDVVLKLYTPDGTTWYEPAVQEETSARFNISNAAMGMYSVEIEGYKACGAINTAQSGTAAVMVNGSADSGGASSDTASSESGSVAGGTTGGTSDSTSGGIRGAGGTAGGAESTDDAGDEVIAVYE